MMIECARPSLSLNNGKRNLIPWDIASSNISWLCSEIFAHCWSTTYRAIAGPKWQVALSGQFVHLAICLSHSAFLFDLILFFLSVIIDFLFTYLNSTELIHEKWSARRIRYDLVVVQNRIRQYDWHSFIDHSGESWMSHQVQVNRVIMSCSG